MEDTLSDGSECNGEDDAAVAKCKEQEGTLSDDQEVQAVTRTQPEGDKKKFSKEEWEAMNNKKWLKNALKQLAKLRGKYPALYVRVVPDVCDDKPEADCAELQFTNVRPLTVETAMDESEVEEVTHWRKRIQGWKFWKWKSKKEAIAEHRLKKGHYAPLVWQGDPSAEMMVYVPPKVNGKFSMHVTAIGVHDDETDDWKNTVWRHLRMAYRWMTQDPEVVFDSFDLTADHFSEEPVSGAEDEPETDVKRCATPAGCVQYGHKKIVKFSIQTQHVGLSMQEAMANTADVLNQRDEDNHVRELKMHWDHEMCESPQKRAEREEDAKNRMSSSLQSVKAASGGSGGKTDEGKGGTYYRTNRLHKVRSRLPCSRPPRGLGRGRAKT